MQFRGRQRGRNRKEKIQGKEEEIKREGKSLQNKR